MAWLGRVLHQPLAGARPAAGLACSRCLQQAVHGVVQLLGGDHLVHEADAQGLGGVKALAGQEVALPGAGTHGAQHVGGDGGRDQADLDLAEAEVGAVHADGHVAGRHQAQAAGVDIALHAGDGGVRQV